MLRLMGGRRAAGHACSIERDASTALHPTCSTVRSRSPHFSYFQCCSLAGAKAKREENGIKGQDSGGFSFPAGPGQDDAEEAPSTAPQPAWQPSANPAQSADEVKATPDAAQVSPLAVWEPA